MKDQGLWKTLGRFHVNERRPCSAILLGDEVGKTLCQTKQATSTLYDVACGMAWDILYVVVEAGRLTAADIFYFDQ